MSSFDTCSRVTATVEWAENFKCGEGPYYVPTHRLLYWVSIPDQKLMFFNIDTKQNTAFGTYFHCNSQ